MVKQPDHAVIGKVDDLRLSLLELLTNSTTVEKIGIGITTHNRPEQFRKTYDEICRRSPGIKIVIVDDASKEPVPGATYRFQQNVGIAIAKNKCFELLDDCDHIFLFDDDTYPLVDHWWTHYIRSGQPHLMYIFDKMRGVKMGDIETLYVDDRIKAYTHPRGCMMYFHKSCLEKVGGMSPAFGRWGWEHPDLSNRIYNNGMTLFKYMDIPYSEGMFYSGDEHVTVASTVPDNEKSHWIARNKAIYEGRQDAKEFIPYKMENNIILTSLFFNVEDPQRGAKWSTIDDINIEPLIKSLNGLKLVILTDHRLNPAIEKYLNFPNVEAVKVSATVNPYFQRWISYHQYLNENRGKIDKVFCVDATDVEVLRNPFNEIEPFKLYTGDEPSALRNDWMVNNHKYPKLQEFFQSNAAAQLLNAGLLGGQADIVQMFAHYMVNFYSLAKTEQLTKGVPDAGSTDMGAFNFVARTSFNQFLVHGGLVNTRFKANERNHYSWFKHK